MPFACARVCRIPALIVLFPLIATGRALAQPPAPAAAAAAEPSYPTFNVGTLTYLQYDAELEHRDSFNAFDLTRGYINITGDLAKNIKFRITPDVKRITDGTLAGSLVFRVKYAFAELDNVLMPNSWLRFGAHQTPWLDFEEGINRYRVQGQMFAEREGVIPGSSDLGVGYLARFPNEFGEVQGGVYNGEGYATAEANRDKSVQLRVTVRPFPRAGLAKGLRLSGYYNAGWYAPDQPRRHGIVMASYEQTHLVATAQWLAATERPRAAAVATSDRRGYSAFVEVKQGMTGWAGLLRFEKFDADRRTPDNSDRRTIAGVAYWLKWDKARIGLVLDDEDVRYDASLNKPDENRFLAQMHIQF